MDVRFTKTGHRQYGIAVRCDGAWGPTLTAPGFDEHIPHDLVHFLVEAELGLALGVFGRQAAGGGRFPVADRTEARRRARREDRLKALGHPHMARSETITSACTVLWKLRHGFLQEVPDWLRGRVPSGAAGPAGPAGGEPASHGRQAVSPADRDEVERVLARLDAAAETWHQLGIGEAMILTWPHRPVSRAAVAATPGSRTRQPRRRPRGRCG